MKFLKYILISGIAMLFSCVNAGAQSPDYQSLKTLKPDMQRKVMANELMVSPDNKYLIVNYGNKPTFIVAYNIEDWRQAAAFRLTDWVEFSSAYVDTTNSQFYVKTGRISSEYHRLDIKEKTQDVVPCDITPRRCPVIELKVAIKSVYTIDKKYFVTINKKNKREVKVYEKRAAQ